MSARLVPARTDGSRAATIVLAHRKGRVVARLSTLTIAAYFAFMGVFAFDKPLLGLPLAPGLTLCLVLGPALILGGILVSLAYVLWANLVFDAALERDDAARDARSVGNLHAQ